MLLNADPDKQPHDLTAKVCDFGLSTSLGTDNTHVSNFKAGTPLYVAPEVVLNNKVSQASDVYAFGIMIWEVCMGRRCYTLRSKHEAVPAADFGIFDDSIDSSYGLLCVLCMRRDPSLRLPIGDVLSYLSAIEKRLWQQSGDVPKQLPPALLEAVAAARASPSGSKAPSAKRSKAAAAAAAAAKPGAGNGSGMVPSGFSAPAPISPAPLAAAVEPDAVSHMPVAAVAAAAPSQSYASAFDLTCEGRIEAPSLERLLASQLSRAELNQAAAPVMTGGFASLGEAAAACQRSSQR